MAADTLTTTNTTTVFTEDDLKLRCGDTVIFHAREMGILCKKGEKLLQIFHKSGQEYCAGLFLLNKPEELSSYLEGITTAKEALSVAPVLVFASRSEEAAKMILAKLIENIQVSSFHSRNINEEKLPFEEMLQIQRFIELCLECNFEAELGPTSSSLRLTDIFVSKIALFHGISSKTAVSLAHYMAHGDPKVISAIRLRPTANISDGMKLYATTPIRGKIWYNLDQFEIHSIW